MNDFKRTYVFMSGEARTAKYELEEPMATADRMAKRVYVGYYPYRASPSLRCCISGSYTRARVAGST